MPTNTIVFNVNDRNARAGFSRLKREVDSLDSEFKDSRSEAREAGAAIDRLGDQSRTAAKDMGRLGDEARKSSTQIDSVGDASRRTNAAWRDTNRQIADARGRFISAGQGVDTFAKSLGGARTLLTGLGVAVAAREILAFGAASVRAAGQMEGLRRGLEAIEGENAAERLRDFNEIAKLPGLNTPQIIRYSNSLRAAGATASEVDAIITSFGQAIVGLGGNAADTSRAMLQLTQAFGENKISQENFSTIKELIPNFNNLAKEVYNTDGSMDSLNQTFKASGQTLGQFLLPVLARIREEIPAAPVDSYARSVDALTEEFNQFKIAVGTELLPVVSATARGLAGLFDTLTKGVQVVGDFFDVVDEEHETLLKASESAREFSIRLADIATATGQQEAVTQRIRTLYRLRTALKTEQADLSQSSKEYLNYAKQIRTVNNELDTLRNIQGTSTQNNRGQLIAVRTEELQRANTDIARYTQLLSDARDVAVGSTNPAIQQLERSLASSQATQAAVTRELELLKNGFQDLSPAAETAVADITNYGLALSRLKANAEDTFETLRRTPIFSQQVTPNFQDAINASNAYYTERIRQAETALATEEQGTKEYNALETRIFELKRQRIQAEQTLEQTRSKINVEATRQRAKAETDALKRTGEAYVEYRQILTSVQEIQQQAAFRDYIETLRRQGLTVLQILPQLRKYAEFLSEIATLTRATRADAQQGNFTSQLRKDFEETERQGRSLLDVMRQIANQRFDQIRAADLNRRIPNPAERQAAIDEQIATRGTGDISLESLQQEAREAGQAYLDMLKEREDAQQTSLREEERALQRSINARTRQYRQFSNLVSNTFLDLATGRAQNFESVATAFIQQSLRIVLRAFVENQILTRLDDTLTAAKIANLNKVAAAQQASLASLPGLGNLGGLGNLASSLSGGGAALGVSALLFPQEIRNLTSGITDTIGNLLSNVGATADRSFGAQQVLLKIGDNEIKDITDIQDELRQDNRV